MNYQIQRCGVHFVLDGDALGVLELVQGGLDKFGQMIRQVPIRDALKSVVVRVLRHSAVHERPRQVVDGVLKHFKTG